LSASLSHGRSAGSLPPLGCSSCLVSCYWSLGWSGGRSGGRGRCRCFGMTSSSADAAPSAPANLPGQGPLVGQRFGRRGHGVPRLHGDMVRIARSVGRITFACYGCGSAAQTKFRRHPLRPGSQRAARARVESRLPARVVVVVARRHRIVVVRLSLLRRRRCVRDALVLPAGDHAAQHLHVPPRRPPAQPPQHGRPAAADTIRHDSPGSCPQDSVRGAYASGTSLTQTI